MIKHVGKHNQRRVAIVYRKVPDEGHMALVMYTDNLPMMVHDECMKVLESDVGPRILYELASDDELADKLTKASTASALKMIGKLEAKFEAKAEEPAKSKPVAVKSNAPAPINPLRGSSNSGTTVADSENLSFQDYRKLRRAGKIR